MSKSIPAISKFMTRCPVPRYTPKNHCNEILTEKLGDAPEKFLFKLISLLPKLIAGENARAGRTWQKI